MDISLEDFFKNSFVLTIDEEQFNLLKKIFDYHQLCIPQKYEGFQLKKYFTNYINKDLHEIPRRLNAYFGHASIIKLAQYLDLPFVCIYEDDAYPCYDIKNKLEYYLKDISEDADCLILGNTGVVQKKQYNNKFYKFLSNGYGAHAYIVFKNAYKKILDMYNNDSAVPDHVFIGLNVYAPNVNLFIQYNPPKQNNSICGHKMYTYYQPNKWQNRPLNEIFIEFPKIEDILNNKNIK